MGLLAGIVAGGAMTTRGTKVSGHDQKGAKRYLLYRLSQGDEMVTVSTRNLVIAGCILVVLSGS